MSEDHIFQQLNRMMDKLDAVQDKLIGICLTQERHSVILESDIPEIKEDLRQHKEGVIQNRTRVEKLEDLAEDHREILDKVANFREEVQPIIEHVESMRRVTNLLFGSLRKKLMTALTGAIAASALGWGQEIVNWLIQLLN